MVAPAPRGLTQVVLEAFRRHQAELGRWTGFVVFAGAIGRQLRDFPGFAPGVLQVRWVLLTLLFVLFWSAYWRPRPAVALAQRPIDFLLPLAATTVPLLQVPPAFFVQLVGELAPASGVLWQPLSAPPRALGLSLMALGDGIALAGMLTLRGSFSVFTEVREVRTGGVYRFVRHPLYLGEIVSAWGLALDWPTRWQFACALAFTVLQAARARREEQRLLEHSAPYATYAKRVGFLLPGLGRRA